MIIFSSSYFVSICLFVCVVVVVDQNSQELFSLFFV